MYRDRVSRLNRLLASLARSARAGRWRTRRYAGADDLEADLCLHDLDRAVRRTVTRHVGAEPTAREAAASIRGCIDVEVAAVEAEGPRGARIRVGQLLRAHDRAGALRDLRDACGCGDEEAIELAVARSRELGRFSFVLARERSNDLETEVSCVELRETRTLRVRQEELFVRRALRRAREAHSELEEGAVRPARRRELRVVALQGLRIDLPDRPVAMPNPCFAVAIDRHRGRRRASRRAIDEAEVLEGERWRMERVEGFLRADDEDVLRLLRTFGDVRGRAAVLRSTEDTRSAVREGPRSGILLLWGRLAACAQDQRYGEERREPQTHLLPRIVACRITT